MNGSERSNRRDRSCSGHGSYWPTRAYRTNRTPRNYWPNGSAGNNRAYRSSRRNGSSSSYWAYWSVRSYWSSRRPLSDDIHGLADDRWRRSYELYCRNWPCLDSWAAHYYRFRRVKLYERDRRILCLWNRRFKRYDYRIHGSGDIRCMVIKLGWCSGSPRSHRADRGNRTDRSYRTHGCNRTHRPARTYWASRSYGTDRSSRKYRCIRSRGYQSKLCVNGRLRNAIHTKGSRTVKSQRNDFD